MDEKQKEEALHTLGLLVLQIRSDIAELMDFYDNHLVGNEELVYAFDDKYPFKEDLNEVHLKAIEWDRATGQKHRKVVNKLNGKW